MYIVTILFIYQMTNNDSTKLGTLSMPRVRIPPSEGRREIASIMLPDGLIRVIGRGLVKRTEFFTSRA